MTTGSVTDLAGLRAAVAAGWQPDYLFFWGHKGRPDSLGKHVLSQWWPASFEIDGHLYPTAEHFMMAEKARLFGDTAIAARILAAAEPGAAKALGRKVSGFEPERWAAACQAIVERGNRAKFAQNPAMGGWLRKTGAAVLVEASPVDPIWGIGLAADDPRAQDPREWLGTNFLGFALMQVRAALNEAAAAPPR